MKTCRFWVSLTEDNFQPPDELAMTQWVSRQKKGCAYCHAVMSISKPTGRMTFIPRSSARRMIQMTQQHQRKLGSGHVNAVDEVGVNCYTCHGGENVPSDVWFNLGHLSTKAVGGWSAVQNRATSLSSVHVFALECAGNST